MSSEDSRGGVFPPIDADAVCELCGSVNPEGTLLCKTCGNNLRDQRVRRIANHVPLEGPKVVRIRFFSTLLTAVLIVAVIGTAFCVPEIENWYMHHEMRESADVEDYWSKKGGATFETMLAQLMANTVTDEEAQNAENFPQDPGVFAGRYVIKLERPGHTNPVIGQGIVLQVDNKLYILAVAVGGIQLRGAVNIPSNDTIEIKESVGVRMNTGEPSAIIGYAYRRDDGSLECFGQTTAGSRPYTVYAYRVP